MEQFNALTKLYLDWNDKINLISRKDTDYIEERHLVHSLAITKAIQFESGSKVLDIGTGGGFPGIPLSIYYPDCQFFLVDSIGKKIKVVKDIIEKLGLKNVSAQHMRVEQFKGEVNYVTCRAVAPAFELLRWIRSNKNLKHSKPGKFVFLKGGDLKPELDETKMPFKIFGLKDHFEENFFETKSVVMI